MEMDMGKLTTVRDELDENVSQFEFNFLEENLMEKYWKKYLKFLD